MPRGEFAYLSAILCQNVTQNYLYFGEGKDSKKNIKKIAIFLEHLAVFKCIHLKNFKGYEKNKRIFEIYIKFWSRMNYFSNFENVMILSTLKTKLPFLFFSLHLIIFVPRLLK